MAEFSCLHCGKCCEDTLVQINLTFGDIHRISTALGKTVSEMFSEGLIDFNPFLDPETGEYDIELGLNKPCRLMKKGAGCIIHRARPLNCRLFPYWLLAEFKELKEIAREGYGCLDGLKLNDAQRAQYRKYAKGVGEILLKESEITDAYVERIKGELGWEPGGFDAGGILGDLGLEEKRLQGMKELISKIDMRELKQRVAKGIEEGKWATIAELEEKERILRV
jgi:Fe-S-cluster containining protein